jgi:hypothetical protein
MDTFSFLSHFAVEIAVSAAFLFSRCRKAKSVAGEMAPAPALSALSRNGRPSLASLGRQCAGFSPLKNGKFVSAIAGVKSCAETAARRRSSHTGVIGGKARNKTTIRKFQKFQKF